MDPYIKIYSLFGSLSEKRAQRGLSGIFINFDLMEYAVRTSVRWAY